MQNLIAFELPILRVQQWRIWITQMEPKDLPALSITAEKPVLMHLSMDDSFITRQQYYSLKNHFIDWDADDEVVKITNMQLSLAFKGGFDPANAGIAVENDEAVHKVLLKLVTLLELRIVNVERLREQLKNNDFEQYFLNERALEVTVRYNNPHSFHKTEGQQHARHVERPPRLHTDVGSLETYILMHPGAFRRMRRHALPQLLYDRVQLMLDMGQAPSCGVMPPFPERFPVSNIMTGLIELMRHNAAYQLAAVVLAVPSLLELFGLRPASIYAEALSDADMRLQVDDKTCEMADREEFFAALKAMAEDTVHSSDAYPRMPSVLPSIPDANRQPGPSEFMQWPKLLEHLDKSRFMLAGGFALSRLLSQECPESHSTLRGAGAAFVNSDVDLFPIGRAEDFYDEEATESGDPDDVENSGSRVVVREVLRAIQRHLINETQQDMRAPRLVLQAAVVITASAASIVLDGLPVVQVILRYSPTPQHVLQNFDLDCVGVGLYNGKLYVSNRCLRALTTGCNWQFQDYESVTFGGDPTGYFARMTSSSLTTQFGSASFVIDSPQNNYDGSLLSAEMLANGVDGVVSGLLQRASQAVNWYVDNLGVGAAQNEEIRRWPRLSFLFDVVDLSDSALAAAGWPSTFEFLLNVCVDSSNTLDALFARFGRQPLAHRNVGLLQPFMSRDLYFNEGRFRGVFQRDDWYLMHQLTTVGCSPARFLASTPLLRLGHLTPPHPLSSWDVVLLIPNFHLLHSYREGWEDGEEALRTQIKNLGQRLVRHRDAHSKLRKMWTLLQSFLVLIEQPALVDNTSSAKQAAETALRAHAECTSALLRVYSADSSGEANSEGALERIKLELRQLARPHSTMLPPSGCHAPAHFTPPPASFWVAAAANCSTTTVLLALIEQCLVRLRFYNVMLEQLMTALVTWQAARYHDLRQKEGFDSLERMTEEHCRWQRELNRLEAERTAEEEVAQMQTAYAAAFDAQHAHKERMVVLEHRLKARNPSYRDRQELLQL
ncbi:hypothetical protein HDU87_008015 [Geranomyces variabilis]|uniref:Uncharacterized protein n=1 Tax=Geranomyces variabilis TaxID=109894 RepID=A0AAD5XSN2_9FUNG|nr:hypothetical protein HDU87_008015 [Geranomyces variabilis]